MVLLNFLVFTSIKISRVAKEDVTDLKEFGKHYAFICDLDYNGEMWKEIFEGASKYAEKNDAYVEWFGKNLMEKYTKVDLVKMAVAAKVDGIILQGDDSEELVRQIEQAKYKGIPVVTLSKDCFGSYRNSFIGISSYNLGKEYANYLISNARPTDKSILVVIESELEDDREKLIYTGFKESMQARSGKVYDIDTMIVGRDVFEVEKSVRELLLSDEQLPDIIVCLDELTTSAFSQLTVDYNRVGESRIIGFYDSETCLYAIERKILEASLTTNANYMGTKSIDVLNDCAAGKVVSEYLPIDTQLITRANVKSYIDKKKYNESKQVQ
ncbi:MAG: substrate-binding domain-containing protein [Lachnospiraceae bacterium]|nr:substrate-binding domain-containing protein [Lachnospiraceae bacterium]